jgi:hypothetical protein
MVNRDFRRVSLVQGLLPLAALAGMATQVPIAEAAYCSGRRNWNYPPFQNVCDQRADVAGDDNYGGSVRTYLKGGNRSTVTACTWGQVEACYANCQAVDTTASDGTTGITQNCGTGFFDHYLWLVEY